MRKSLSFFVILILCYNLFSDDILSTVSFDTWALLSNGKAVYMDYHYVTSTVFWAEVISYDLNTKTKKVEVPSGTGAAYPYYIEYGYSKNNLAWIPFDIGGSGGGGGGSGGYVGGRTTYLYYKNISSGTSKQLITSNAWKQMVWVGGDIVTWVDYRNWDSLTIDSLNSEIYLYNLTTNQEKRVTTDHSYQEKPVTDGTNLAYIDYSSNYGKLFLYNISSGSTVEVSPYMAGKDNPRVYGNIIVWEDYRNATSDKKNADIFMYDISTQTTKPICTAPKYQGNPYVYGKWIVWEDYRNSTPSDSLNSDIYAYDITTNSEFPVVTGPSYQGHPTLLSDTVCWIDYSGGSMKLMMKKIEITNVIHKETLSYLKNLPVAFENNQFTIGDVFNSRILEVKLIDIKGRCIVNKKQPDIFGNKYRIIFNSTLKNGTYFVKVCFDNGEQITKTIIKAN
jgi:beta propeller repeat protein